MLCSNAMSTLPVVALLLTVGTIGVTGSSLKGAASLRRGLLYGDGIYDRSGKIRTGEGGKSGFSGTGYFSSKDSYKIEKLRCTEDSHCGFYTGYCGEGACECMAKKGRGGYNNGHGPRRCRPGDEMVLCDVEPCSGKTTKCLDGYCALLDPLEDGPNLSPESMTTVMVTTGSTEPAPSSRVTEAATTVRGNAPALNVCETDDDCDVFFITEKDESDPWDICSCQGLPGIYPDIGCQQGPCISAMCLENTCAGKSVACSADKSCQLIDAVPIEELPPPCVDDGDCRKFFEGCDCSCTALHVTNDDPVWTKPFCAACAGNSCDSVTAVCNGETNVCELVELVFAPNVCETDNDCQTYWITEMDEADPWAACGCEALPKGYPDVGCQTSDCMVTDCPNGDGCKGYLAVCKNNSCELGKPPPVETTATPPAELCGKSVCAEGQVCCNPSCGICTMPNGACIQIACLEEPVGEVCGNTVCANGEVCCNPSCGICTPLGGACTDEICTDDNQVRTCTDDSECKVVDDYCGGCNCLALFNDQKPANCEPDEIVNCFVAPCMFLKAQCVDGVCAAVSADEPPLKEEEKVRMCTNDSECKAVDDYCGGCNCLALFGDLEPPYCDPKELFNCAKAPCMNKEAQCVDGECIAVTAEPPSSMPICAYDSECKVMDDYCGGCNCLGLFKDENPIGCDPSELFNCFVAPCMDMEAQCVDGDCVASSLEK